MALPTAPIQITVLRRPKRVARRLEMMLPAILATKMTVTRRSHCSSVKPITSMKKPGNTMKKPNIDAVLMVRTTPLSEVFGSSHMIETLPISDVNGFSPTGARRLVPAASFTHSRASAAPAITRISDSQNVASAPINGTEKLATSAPRVGRPAA